MKNRSLRIMFFALAVALIPMFMTTAAHAAIGVVVSFGPPPIPVYEQPICPGDGYLWTPGYWAWDDGFDDYYWVPGTWILAPEVGFFWTPGWWGWGGNGFVFTEGFWGPTIGFYGGINYGFGYFGTGFVGGRWDNGHFFYNRAVANINVTEIHNVYETRVTETTVNRVSYNGGEGGVVARATAQEEAAARDRHVGPVAAQNQHMEQARSNPDQRASRNQGRPPVAATAKAGDFKTGAVRASEAGGAYKPPTGRAAGNEAARGTENRPAGGNAGNSGHVRDLPPATKMQAPNTGDAKLDKKYQQQQDKLAQQQDKERQKIAQQQQKEDDRAAKQKANTQKQQQMEQRHQQQTSDLVQKHQQQTQALQQRQSAPAPRAGGRPPK